MVVKATPRERILNKARKNRAKVDALDRRKTGGKFQKAITKQYQTFKNVVSLDFESPSRVLPLFCLAIVTMPLTRMRCCASASLTYSMLRFKYLIIMRDTLFTAIYPFLIELGRTFRSTLKKHLSSFTRLEWRKRASLSTASLAYRVQHRVY